MKRKKQGLEEPAEEYHKWSVAKLVEYCLQNGITVSLPGRTKAPYISAIRAHKGEATKRYKGEKETVRKRGETPKEDEEEEGEEDEEKEGEDDAKEEEGLHLNDTSCPLYELTALGKSSSLLQLTGEKWPLEEGRLIVKWVEDNEHVFCPDEDCWGNLIRCEVSSFLDTLAVPAPLEKTMREITGDELLPLTTRLGGRRYTDWAEDDIDFLIATFAGVRSINMKDASKEAIAAYTAFEDDFHSLVEARPDIAEKIDPTYVIVDITAGIPAGYEAALAAAPAALGAAVQNGRNWMLGVAGATASAQKLNARHLGGFLSGRIAGLDWWMVTTTTPPVYW